ncbi:HNH endonuclease [Streptomyces sp. NPDC091268]|uniref:HNH endonuclease n=1 Tax=Streptomyces sp. NPDC091268 TaxID=3365979 RepID=UPI0038283B80
MTETTVPRGSRARQATYIWLMSLTANNGMCTYCAVQPSTTLDHEQPVAGNGADVWWNFLPACKPCNDWKRGRSPLEWLIDQKLHREHPRTVSTLARCLFGCSPVSIRASNEFVARSAIPTAVTGSAITSGLPGTGTRTGSGTTWTTVGRRWAATLICPGPPRA